MTKTLAHVTINSGHVHHSPIDEIQPHIMAMMQPRIRSSRFEALPGYVCHIIDRGPNHLQARLSDEDHNLLVSIGVASHSTAEAAMLWERLQGKGEPPQAPWCAVLLDAQLLLTPPADVEWMADFERCLAWTWLASSEAQHLRSHQLETEAVET